MLRKLPPELLLLTQLSFFNTTVMGEMGKTRVQDIERTKDI